MPPKTYRFFGFSEGPTTLDEEEEESPLHRSLITEPLVKQLTPSHIKFNNEDLWRSPQKKKEPHSLGTTDSQESQLTTPEPTLIN
jgi:hypothetical protein